MLKTKEKKVLVISRHESHDQLPKSPVKKNTELGALHKLPQAAPAADSLLSNSLNMTRSGLETQVGCRHSSVVELDLAYKGTWGSIHNMRHAGSAMEEGKCKW